MRRMHKARTRRRPAWAKLAVFAIAIAALAAAWRFTPLAELLTPSRIRAFARLVGRTPWAPLAVMAAYTPAAFLMFPRPLITLVAIVAFGLALGGACVVVGILAAALATYCAGRVLPYSLVRRLAGTEFERFTGLLRRHGVMAVFAANLLPVPPFGVQGILAGAIRIPVWRYAAGTALSLLPGLVGAMIFGHEIVVALEDPSKVSYAAIGTAALGLLIVGYFATRWAARQAARAQ
jgi:uncharacterized membrane protein YdjX (TVP38/TMEM64 family)